MSYLKRCPCGRVPVKVVVHAGNSCKYAYVSGDCCGEWEVEFRTGYFDIDHGECRTRAEAAWNNAPRGDQNRGGHDTDY